ncbi:MAG: hypothetical protein J6T34_02550, partial [Bacilli bacterium]|nr:hypothetical protein [Bacilli bacterium]
KNMDVLLAEPQPRLRDPSICEESTACLPCRVAVREMLKKCGQDEEVSAMMKQKMHLVVRTNGCYVISMVKF